MAKTNHICVIATTPRTGSNFLVSRLNDTNQLGYGREYFSNLVTRGHFPSRRPTIQLQVEHAIKDGTSPNGVTMIKLHPNQFARVEAKISFQRCFPAARWIWLRRSNLIAQAISHEIASQTGAWISSQTGICVPEYSTASIRQRISDIEAGNQQWNAYFKRNNIAPLCLWYEEICAAPENAAHAVAALMQVELGSTQSAGKGTNRYAGIRKQGSDINTDWANRYLRETTQ